VKELIWDNSLSVQIEEIDEDHRRLVDLFNLLNRSLADGDSPDYIAALLEELISCTVWHFRHEERLMLKYAYDGLAGHRDEHDELVASARALQQKFLQAGKSLSSEDVEFLEHWVTGHILSSDMAMSDYLCEVM